MRSSSYYLPVAVCRSLALTIAMGIAAANCTASHAAGEDWPAILATYREAYTPVTDVQVLDAVDQFRISAGQVHRYTGGDSKPGEDWRRYLKTEQQTQALRRGADQDVSFWQKMLRRVSILSPGMENQAFQNYRKDLRQLINLLEARDVPDGETEYRNTLDQLERVLPTKLRELTPKAATEISEAIALLQHRGQAAPLVHRIRTAYSRPNARFTIPVGFVASQFNSLSENTAPVRMTIDGASVRGTSHTVSQASVSLPDNDRFVGIDLSVTGTSHTRSRSYKNRVAIHNTSVLQFTSSSQLTLGEQGIKIMPFTSQGHLSTRITGVTSPGLGMRKLFARMAAERRKPYTQQEARTKSLRQLESALYQELSNSVLAQEQQFRKEVLLPLQCRDIVPSSRATKVQDGKIYLDYLFDANGGLGSTFQSAPAESPDRPLASLHESAFNNSFANLLGGKRMSLTHFFHLLSGESKGETTRDKSKDLFVTFSSKHPLQLELADNQIIATLNIEKFGLDEQQYAAMDIQLTYEMDSDAERPTLRSLNPQVLRPRQADGSRPKMGIRNYSLRRVLLNTLSRDQPESLSLDRIAKSLTNDSSASIQSVLIREGWLQLFF